MILRVMSRVVGHQSRRLPPRDIVLLFDEAIVRRQKSGDFLSGEVIQGIYEKRDKKRKSR